MSLSVICRFRCCSPTNANANALEHPSYLFQVESRPEMTLLLHSQRPCKLTMSSSFPTCDQAELPTEISVASGVADWISVVFTALRRSVWRGPRNDGPSPRLLANCGPPSLNRAAKFSQAALTRVRNVRTIKVICYAFLKERTVVARLTISVPDDLIGLLKKYKSQVNVSRLCSAAIERKIVMLKALDENSDLLTKAAARLRAERARLGDESAAEGYKAGVCWVSNAADYGSIKWLVDLEEFSKRDSSSVATKVWQEREELAQDYADEIREGSFDPENWWKGFMKGALATWEKLRPLVEE